MQLERLTIGLKNEYGKPGPGNPYEAKLSVSYNDNKMQVKLSHETCQRILAMAGDEIAAAAQIQVSEFVRTALTVSEHAAIEAHPI